MHPSLLPNWQKTSDYKDKYLQLFAGYSAVQRSFQPSEKEWNLLGVAHHLIKAEKATVKYVKYKLSQQKALNKPWDNALKMVGLKLALWLPFRYKVPAKDLHPDKDITLESITTEWDAIRAEMKELLDNFPAEYLDKKIFKHPLAGPMTIKETLGFWHYHLKHHDQQLRRIITDKHFPVA